MKTFPFFLILIIFSSCRRSSPTNFTDILVSGKEVNVASPQGDNVQAFLNISEANSHIEKLRGPFRVVIDQNVKVDDFFNIMNGVACSGVGSVKIISDEDEHLQATFEFPLSDNNVSHWQFQVQDNFSWNTKTKSTGIDTNKNIAWIRVEVGNASVKIDEKELTINEFKILLQTMRNGHDRVAVGILVADVRRNFIEILRLLAAIENEKCKAIIVPKEDR